LSSAVFFPEPADDRKPVSLPTRMAYMQPN
jgi:hypothetical protein